MPWNQNIFPLLIVTASGGFTGAFFYSPAPGAGKLIASVTAAPGTDPYGNLYQQGVTVYQIGAIPGLFLELLGASMVISSNAAGTKITHGSIINITDTTVVGTGPALNLFSPNTLANTQAGRALVSLLGESQDLTAPAIVVTDTQWAWDPNVAAHSQAETWHSLGSPSATGYTSTHGRFRLTPTGEVEFDVILTANGGGGTAGTYTYATTLPAVYQPAFNRSYPLGYNGTIAAGQNFPALRITTAGAVVLQIPGLPATTVITGTISMPLD